MKFETKRLTLKPDYAAPDGSEIRLLPTLKGGGLSHCTLPPKCVSKRFAIGPWRKSGILFRGMAKYGANKEAGAKPSRLALGSA